MKIRNKKFQKSKNRKEELPSFLLNLKEIPEDVIIPPKKKKKFDQLEPCWEGLREIFMERKYTKITPDMLGVSYLGPVFFGECLQFHPPHHSVPLSSIHHIQFSAPSKENILKEVFLPKPVGSKKKFEYPKFHPSIKRKKEFVDLYSHKCPGVRRIFACDSWVPEGLGETKSVIEGETSREIPFCRFKEISFDCYKSEPKPQFEIVTLSDIREEKRIFMSYEERMAHSHFPKEFATVRIIGPVIPEPIVITKMPSKRQTSFAIDLHLKSETKSTINTEEEKNRKSLKDEVSETENEKEESVGSVLSPLTKQDSNVEKRRDSDSEKQQSEEMEETGDSERSQIVLDGIEEQDEEEEGEGEEEEEAEEIETLDEEGEEKVKEKERSVVFADERNSIVLFEEENVPGDAEN